MTAIARRVGRTLKAAGFGGIMFCLGCFYGPVMTAIGHGVLDSIVIIGSAAIKRIV